MPDKPRVKAPRQRAGSSADGAKRPPVLAVAVATAGLVAGIVAVLVIIGLAGGGEDFTDREASARAALEAAGCTLQVEEALPGQHSIADPGDVSDEWNTDPPTSGPHYAIAAIFGIYEEPLEVARVVHNLEHGGVFIAYGPDVAGGTVEQLRAFYNANKTGTIMAPYEKLGDEFALGAWVTEGEDGNGYLAKCAEFEEAAASAFLAAFQFRGPERFDPSQLQPGL